MKNLMIILLAISTLTLSSCGSLKNLDLDQIAGALEGSGLSNEKIIAGLREALNVGTRNSVSVLEKKDGFLKNSLVKIALPPEAQKIATKLSNNPIGKQLVDDFIVKMNRAAEGAAADAKPIFISAIKGITISDGLSILKGADNEATMYLKNKTYSKLVSSYKPKIKTSLDKIKLDEAWKKVTTVYNALPGTSPVNVDLSQYVTEKATDGVFKLVAKEEKKIREDPVARVTDLLKDVFGTLD